MPRRASPKTLLNRRIKNGDFPFVIGRHLWIDIITVLLLPVWLAMAAMFLWVALMADLALGWAVVFPLLLGLILPIACYVGLDNIGFKLIVDDEGITAKGLLVTRYFRWNEITRFDTWRGRAVTDDGVIPLGFYQAVIHVDGSDDPKRLIRNMLFAGHFVPPMMELGGKELIKLLAKAKQAATQPDRRG